MRESDDLLVQTYERAVARLQSLEKDIHESLKSCLGKAGSSGSTGAMRELAFLEGLRQERDSAREDARRAELEIVNQISARLGIPPERP